MVSRPKGLVAKRDGSTFKGTAQNMVITIFQDPVDWQVLKAKLSYFAYGEETCATTGTPHKQAFARAWHPLRFKAWKELFPTAHLEKMMGTFRRNELYCSKEGNLVEFGDKPNETGVQNKVLAIRQKLDEGQDLMEIADTDEYVETYMRYRGGFTELARYKRAKRLATNRDVPDIYVRIGPAGTGKTRWLDEQFGPGNWVPAPDNNGRWFDGCDRDVILFDDVQAGEIPPLGLFKRLTDRYPIQVPVKGGFITWKPKTIVFTSNTHPSEWWKDLTEFDKAAIERRITEVVVVE